METIISACISAGVTLVICLLNNHGQQEKTRALMEYKLDELTKRVDKHNNVVERTYSIERRLSVQEEQIRVADHRISDLEGIEHEDSNVNAVYELHFGRNRSAGLLGQRDRAGNQGDASIEENTDECCGTDHITDPDTGSSDRLVHLLSDSD